MLAYLLHRKYKEQSAELERVLAEAQGLKLQLETAAKQGSRGTGDDSQGKNVGEEGGDKAEQDGADFLQAELANSRAAEAAAKVEVERLQREGAGLKGQVVALKVRVWASESVPPTS